MSTPTMKQILESTRSLVMAKQAEFKTNLRDGVKTAKGLDTTGAGDDSEITRGSTSAVAKLEADQAALEPTKKSLLSADAKANPPSDGSGTAGESAKGKDENNQTDRSEALEADQAALEPTKKSLLSADANAKKASVTLANEILRDIRAAQASTKQASDVKEVPVVTDAKKPAKKVESDKPAVEATPAAADDDKTDKEASDVLRMELTTDVMAKIAAIVLSTEEGSEFVEHALAKQAGKEAALETLNFLASQAELAEKQAAYQQGQADAEALLQQAIFEAGVAEGRNQNSSSAVLAKLGQQVADASIEDLMQQGGADLGVAPMEGGGEGDISIEELAQGLQELVQDGTLQPEEAQQVIEFLAQQEGGEAAPEAVPEAAPEAAPEAVPAEKESATKKASDLLEQIRALRQAQTK